MKKNLLILLLSFVTCISFVSAQETDQGLSPGECKWKNVKQILINKTVVWKECTEDDTTGCVYKFCNGLLNAGPKDKPDAWTKDSCNKYCITLQESLPLKGLNVKSISGDSGVDLLGNYFSLWYKIGALILGLIGVLVIVISGVQIIFGGVSDEMISGAKTRIWAAILSLILLFSSALILQTINPLFFT